LNIPQPSDLIEPIPQAIPTDSDGMVFCLVNMFRVSAVSARKAVDDYQDALPAKK
jgi:hypothetical protein